MQKYISYNKHKRNKFVKNTNENVIGIWNLAFRNWTKNMKIQLPNAKCQMQKTKEEQKMLKKQKGITLIALIITIIVMLILVGVTVNVALNGGLFNKAKEAGTKTKVEQIKEALLIKKAEVLAEHDGVVEEYDLTIDDLSLPSELKTEYGSKLKISTDGKLYYDASVVTNEEEQNQFESMGIQEYVETNAEDEYYFTITELVSMEGLILMGDGYISIPFDNFWIRNVSDELKNSTITRNYAGSDMVTYNIKCLNEDYSNIFDMETVNRPQNGYMICLQQDSVVFMLTNEDGDPINNSNYTNYLDLAFTISLPE